MKQVISIIGARGFIGRSLLTTLEPKYLVEKVNIRYPKQKLLEFNSDVVIHLAGIAHDFRNTNNQEDYYIVNTQFTIDVFNVFLKSKASTFIFVSSVKAVADNISEILTEDHLPNPLTHYGKSKLLAEQFILHSPIPEGKRFIILRPCMIHGPNNKGNLNHLFELVSKGIPWPLGSFDNRRSYCSIDNFCFVVLQIISKDGIPSGIYNVSDDVSLSTNEVVRLIAYSIGQKSRIYKINKYVIYLLAFISDILKLPLNYERLHKLTQNYEVSNAKLLATLGIELPVSSIEGLVATFNSFIKKK